MTFNLTTSNAVIYKSTNMKRKRRTCITVCLLLTGIILISVGILIFVYFASIYDFLINSAMTFNRKSEPYRVWKINDPPLEMDIYMFNWTNPDEILTPGVKPKFQEVGPYKMREVKEKINITWHDHNNTISYRHRKFYYVDDQNTGGRPLTDVITTINIVPLAIAYKARHYGFITKRMISSSLSSLSSLHVTKTVGEILFYGYEESILSILSNLPLSGVQDKFGMFYGKNGSMGDDGIFSMWTKNDEDFGKVKSWNYKNQSTYYEGSCNDVRGSAGEFYPINRKRDYLELFSSEFCRIARFEYEKDVVIKGVTGYKYTARNIFDNGTLDERNACYCIGECQPSGVLNVSSCRQDSPTFLSMPHFYGGDPYYTESVEGIDPQDKHEFFVTLEPKSGIVIDIGARMQVNVLLQPVDYITMYEEVPKIFFPVFYFDQTITLKDDLAPILQTIQKLPDYSNIAVLILVSLGLMSLIWMGINVYCCTRRKFGDELKIPQNTCEEIPLRS